ncbi:NTP transferase domain-containing protein [Candidatus Kaiserbacteria bacterium]|nr:NTP transferase domain-containing protein [Candidatus Kaiserbacteria bacterium]
MQCVILAAGKGTRMRPLTETTPKPLLRVGEQALLDYVVAALPPVIDELIIVTNYLEEQIMTYCGTEFHGRRVQYVHQDNPAGGTGAALLCAAPLIIGRFLFMYADDIHGAAALAEVVTHDHAMLAMPSDTPEQFGVVYKNDDGTLREIIEKPAAPTSNLVNIGGFVITPDIFNYQTAAASDSGEVYVTDMLTAYAKNHPVQVIEQTVWIPVGTPEQLAAAEKMVLSQKID